MAVFRIERTKDYTVMSNHHLRNHELSLKAKGLLSMMLSLPDDWNYTTRGLAKICKEGVDAIGSALRELETAGYIVRNQLRDQQGRISDTEYVIYEKPQPRQAGGNLTASDGGNQLFQPRDLSNIGGLVNEAPHMDRQPPAVHIVRFFAEQIEQLGVAHGDQEVKAIVRVAHNQEQGGFPVSQGIQLQLVVGRDLPQLRDVEHGKARTAGNQDGFCGFARDEKSRTF